MAVVDSVCLSILEATTYMVGMENLDIGTVGAAEEDNIS
jgi:hypothetical protein